MKNLIKITAIIFAFALVVASCDKKQDMVHPIENNIEPTNIGVIKGPFVPPGFFNPGFSVFCNGEFICCDYMRSGDCLWPVVITASPIYRGVMGKLDDIIINNPGSISNFFKENDDWKILFPQLEDVYSQYLQQLKSGQLTMKRQEGKDGLVYYLLYNRISFSGTKPECLAVFPMDMSNK